MTTKADWTNTANVSKEIDINAPQEKICSILGDPRRLSQLVPEVHDVKPAGNNNYSATYTVRVGGIAPLNFPITYYVEADQCPSQVTLHFNGNIEGQVRTSIRPNGNACHVVSQANYKFARKVIDTALPGGGVLGNVAQAASGGIDTVIGNLMTESQKDLEKMLRNLKALCEN